MKGRTGKTALVDLEGLSLVQLKALCTRVGVGHGGTKAALTQRLLRQQDIFIKYPAHFSRERSVGIVSTANTKKSTRTAGGSKQGNKTAAARKCVCGSEQRKGKCVCGSKKATEKTDESKIIHTDESFLLSGIFDKKCVCGSKKRKGKCVCGRTMQET